VLDGRQQLATSFDGFCMFRPFEYNEKWLTKTGWFHLDQNGAIKPDKICVQGFVNYYDAGEADGGLVVVPGSHTIFQEIFRNHPQLGNSSRDFIKLEKFGPVRASLAGPHSLKHALLFKSSALTLSR
jgi:hypothetical protein